MIIEKNMNYKKYLKYREEHPEIRLVCRNTWDAYKSTK
jgi:hypothetical protein